MPLFDIKNNKKVSKLDPSAFKKEKQVQTIFEDNLPVILGIDFVKSEHATSSGGRIDTLGVDRNGSPVIIEYKKSQNDNVINQSLSYLKWLLDHKADFEKLCHNVGIVTEIDWTSPRLICVAENYSKFDFDTVEILPIKIELLRYTVYNSNLLYLDKEAQVVARTNKIGDREERTKKTDSSLQKESSIEAHLAKTTDGTKQVFFKLREQIMGLDKSVVEEPKAKYIAYKRATNFVDVVLLHDSLKIFLNIPSGKLDDPLSVARDLTKPKPVGHWGNGDYEAYVKNENDCESVFVLIKQSYAYNK